MKKVKRNVGVLVLIACCVLLGTLVISTAQMRNPTAYAQEATESTEINYAEIIDSIEAELQEQGVLQKR